MMNTTPHLESSMRDIILRVYSDQTRIIWEKLRLILGEEVLDIEKICPDINIRLSEIVWGGRVSATIWGGETRWDGPTVDLDDVDTASKAAQLIRESIPPSVGGLGRALLFYRITRSELNS